MTDTPKHPAAPESATADEDDGRRRPRRGQASRDPLPVTLTGPCRRQDFQPPALAQWPPTPQLAAGHLVVDNSGWRTTRPAITDSACICCNLCVLLCPDGALANTRDRYPRLLGEWCKGCGICARECPKDAIRMVDEFATGPVDNHPQPASGDPL